MTGVLWTWAFIVLAMSGSVAAVVAFSGLTGFMKNLLVCVVGICLLMLLAMFGRALHNFMLETG